MDRRKVLYITQGLTPFMPDTPLTSRHRAMAQGIAEQGWEVRTFTPKYGNINERRNQLHEVIRLSGINLIIDDTDHPLVIKVATLAPTRNQVYFIDNDDYFRNAAPDGSSTGIPAEGNDERSIFFVRGVMETVKKLRWGADAIFAAGWLSALTPLYVRRRHADDPSFKNAKIIFSITDPATMAVAPGPDLVKKLKMDGFSAADLAPLATDNPDGPGFDELMKMAIAYSDAIIVETDNVSPALSEAIEKSGKPVIYETDPAALATRALELFNSL